MRRRRSSTCCVDSRSRVVFVEDDEQLDKVLAVRERLPLLERIVVFDTEGLRDFSDPRVIVAGRAARARPQPRAARIRASSTRGSRAAGPAISRS